MQKLESEQIEFAAKCVSKYLRLLAAQRINGDTTISLTRLANDVDHSALLGRLLSGKEPFEVPPPRSYSYPDYAMAEGQVVTCEIWNENAPESTTEYCVVVNQSRAWMRDALQKDVLIHTSGLRVKFWPNDKSQGSFNKYHLQKV